MAILRFGTEVSTNANPNMVVHLYNETGQIVESYVLGTLITWSYGQPNPVGVGDSATSDELVGAGANDYIFWDWETADWGSNPVLNGAPTARHFLPHADQLRAIEIFRLQDGNDVLNLTHSDAPSTLGASQAYGYSATAYGGDGNDLLMSAGGDDRLFGETGRDFIYGGGGDDLIDLRGTIAEALNEVAFGGSGNDTIYGDAGNDSLLAGSEDDFVEGFDGLDTIGGDAGNDTLFGGGGGNPTVQGDAIDGGTGNDTLYGGFGADDLSGGVGFLDRIFGGEGEDDIVDSDGFLVMSGDAGNDIMFGTFVANWTAAGNLATVYGGGGSDTFGMNSGQANLNLVIAMDDGSADGNDSIGFSNVANSYATVTATLGAGNDGFRGALGGGTGTRIDRVAGEAGNDTLYGGAGADTLDGGTGFLDFLIGGTSTALPSDAADTLIDADGVVYARGGEGDDFLDIGFVSTWTGAAGNAGDIVTLDGNGGADTFLLRSDNAALRLIINADDGTADGNDTVNWASIASSYDVVTATMGGGNDNYIGTGPGAGTGNRIDIVFGNLGDDTLSGGTGDDTLFGSDSLNATNDGNDTLFGRGGNDTLAGGYGLDTLNGENGNDVMVFNADQTVTGDNDAQDFVRGWDGETTGAVINYGYSGRSVNYSFDVFDGGGGTGDSLVATSGNDVIVYNPDDIFINGSGQTSAAGRLAGIEVVVLGAGADIFIANDPTGTSSSGATYATGLTVYGGNGLDVIYTGSGADLLVGDGGVGNPDVLSGGAGNDTIWGDQQGLADSLEGGRDVLYGGSGADSLFGGAAADSIYGGAGADTLNAGSGDDLGVDVDNASILFGGEGADTFGLSFHGATQSLAGSRTGDDAVGDGDDRVFVYAFDHDGVGGADLAYDSISLSMGFGNDIFISADTTSGQGIDRISGETGNDAISSWSGNDTIDGGSGADVLWGGSGGDTIYGGPDTDYIYAGTGTNDVMFGGTGFDYYYWARYDEAGDQIFDEFRGTPNTGQQAANALLVFPGFDAMGNMPVGTGVVEVDHVLTDNVGGDDMVQLVDIDGAAGTLWRMDIIAGVGAGSSVTFDQRDMQYIALWNHEPGVGQQVIQTYQWDPEVPGGGAYVYISG